MPIPSRFRLALPIVVAVAATSIAACGGDSQNKTQPPPSDTPTGTPGATPLGDGELIVFERAVPGAEEPDLYAVGPDGGEPTLVHSPGAGGHWSPDGTQLAFSACLDPPDCSSAVVLLDRATGELRGLSMPDPEVFTACAVWAPSGEELACEGFGEPDSTRNGIYTLRASDGQGLTRITENSDGDDIPMAFSPDGSQLLLDRTDPSRNEPTNRALFIAPVSGGQPHRITPWGYTDDYANWSPDGRTIVFETKGTLYRVTPEGKGLSKIPVKMADGSSVVGAFDVSFSPDSERILFSLGGSKPSLYTARLDGSDVQQLTSSPTEDHHANWGAAPGS